MVLFILTLVLVNVFVLRKANISLAERIQLGSNSEPKEYTCFQHCYWTWPTHKLKNNPFSEFACLSMLVIIY